MSTDSVKMDTGIPLFCSEIQYLLLETIPLETIMRVIKSGLCLSIKSIVYQQKAICDRLKGCAGRLKGCALRYQSWQTVVKEIPIKKYEISLIQCSKYFNVDSISRVGTYRHPFCNLYFVV